MRDFKTYLSVAPVVSTLWFESLAGPLKKSIIFPNACLNQIYKGESWLRSLNKGSRGVFETQKNHTIRLVGWNCDNSIPIVTNI
ncbi:Photosystem I reaction center subunit IX [Bienertia sinuspersici]